MKISINAPSYKRPDDVKTLSYIPFCKVWVDEDEAAEYKKNYPDANIISCKKGIQGNLCRIRNHILKTEFENGADVALIIDDDFTCIERFVEKGAFKFERYKLTADELLVMVEKYSILAEELGAKFWGVNCVMEPRAYRHFTPFSTNAYIGGPFQCFLKGNRCWYDENLPLKEDYDMTLQQLNKERVVLRVNAYHYLCKQSEQKGGCAVYRNRIREKQQLEALQQKWGEDIVRVDKSNWGKKTKVHEDYNPILKIPIKGI